MVSRRFVLGSLVAGVGGTLLGYSGWRLSAEPLGDKDCGPHIPAKKQGLLNKLSETLNWAKRGGSVNDVSCLSRTPVAGVVTIKSEADIGKALKFARDNGFNVSMAGARHSMGGHAFAPDGVVLDMRGFNAVELDPVAKTIKVQSGATWHDIQNQIHPLFAVKAMQSSDVFTVGGSISVNAHGMDHQAGALEKSIVSMRVMLADGTIRTVSRENNAELYRHVVGGYGLFGVILDVVLEIVDNAILRSERKLIDYKDFPKVFETEIEPEEKINLFYGHLSTAPGSFLRECVLYTYVEAGDETDAKPADLPPLGKVSSVKLRRLIFNLAKKGGLFHRLKWFAEKRLEPLVEACTISRAKAQAEGEVCLVSRNEPMHDSVPYLFNRLNEETDILHEYFVPRDKLISFIDGMRGLMEQEGTTLLNASIRVVHKEDMALNYAPREAFSVVLYINQKVTDEGTEKMKRLTQGLIDLCLENGGRFFLPYQLHYTKAQLKRSYPEIGSFFAEKLTYDPQGVFANRWYETYRGVS